MAHGRSRVVLALLTLLVAGLVAAGCGSDSSSSSSSSGGGGGSGASSGSSGQPGKGKPAVTIGTKDFTEEFILGQLYTQALEAKGYKVNLKSNIGATEIVDKALTRADVPHEGGGVARAVQQARPVVEGVERLDQDERALRRGRPRGRADVLARTLELRVQRDIRQREADEGVEPLAAHGPGELEGDRDVLVEAALPLRIVDEPAVAGGQVPAVEVDQHHVEPGVAHGSRHGVEVLYGRPPELHGGEAGPRGGVKALEERALGEEDGDVGGEAWGHQDASGGGERPSQPRIRSASADGADRG